MRGGNFQDTASAEAAHAAMGVLQKFDLAAFASAHEQSMQELQQFREENLQLRKQAEGEQATFQREREAWEAKREELKAVVQNLQEDHQQTNQAKEELAGQKERQEEEKEALEKRLLALQLETKGLEEQLRAQKDAKEHNEVTAFELRERNQALRVLQERLDREVERRKRGDDRARDLEQQVRVLSERLEESHVQQRRLKEGLLALEQTKRTEAQSFDELRQNWEGRVASVSRELEKEKRTRKVRNLAPLAKVLRLEGILPRSTVLKSLEPDPD